LEIVELRIRNVEENDSRVGIYSYEPRVAPTIVQLLRCKGSVGHRPNSDDFTGRKLVACGLRTRRYLLLNVGNLLQELRSMRSGIEGWELGWV
jgi:hypothetical protein